MPKISPRVTPDGHVEALADTGDRLDHRPLRLGGVERRRHRIPVELAGHEVEQRPHLRRDAGEGVDVVEDTAGTEPLGVHQGATPLGQRRPRVHVDVEVVCLHEFGVAVPVGRHGFDHVLADGGVDDEFAVEGVRDGVCRDVVVSAAEAAGDDHGVESHAPGLDRLADGRAVVGEGEDAGDGRARLGES